MLAAAVTLAMVLISPAAEPAIALFTTSKSQTAVTITAWSGCNAALYQQQVLSLSPTAYLSMQPTGLIEPDASTTGGSWSWTAAPASVAGALSCGSSPGAGVTASTVLSSEGSDVVAAEGVAFSYALWVKAAAGTSGVVFSSAGGLAASGAAARADRALFLRADGTMAVALSDGPVTQALTTTAPVANGSWHLVVVTLKINDLGSARGTRIYVDGTLAGYESRMRKGSAPVAGESWRLGPAKLDAQLGTLIPSATFSGAVDELAVWNRTLTDAEVASLWAARAG